MFYLDEQMNFPDVSQATKEGLLAMGGDLSPERLILAYQSGIFPWFNEGEPVLWWSPNPRFVLFPDKLKISNSMRQLIRKNDFVVTINSAFEEVVKNCANIIREGQPGTWITKTMMEAYVQLHRLDYAKSVEVWQEGQLVGGLYGVDLGNGVFCGESMFSNVSNASKIGLIHFITNSNYRLIDCQVYTKHLATLGAEKLSRNEFMEYLNVNPKI